MDNYPPGAANDPAAPYNEPLEKEETFKFELHLKGEVTLPYYTEEYLDVKLRHAREVLEEMSDRLEEEGYNVDVDFDVKENFSEVW